MSSTTFDDLWNEAMGELDAQLHVEGVDGDDANDGAKGASVSGAAAYFSGVSVGFLSHTKPHAVSLCSRSPPPSFPPPPPGGPDSRGVHL